jgi:hypothetical protein
MEHRVVTRFVAYVSVAAAAIAAIGFCNWVREEKRSNPDLSSGAIHLLDEWIRRGAHDAVAVREEQNQETSPSRLQWSTVDHGKSEEALKALKAEIRQLLMGELDSSEFRIAFDKLVHRLRVSPIDRSQKQRLVWGLAVETLDVNARMRIYDLLERIGTEFAVRAIIEYFDNIQSPDERSRLLLLLNRSLEPINTEAEAHLWRQRVTKNSAAVSDLLLRQISLGDWESPVFREAIELLPQTVSADQVVETYNDLYARGMISDSAYFTGMAQAIISNERNFNTYGIEFLLQISNQDNSIKDAVNSILFPYIAAARLDAQRATALQGYIESQKPRQFELGKDNYDEWAGSYVDWIAARSAASNGESLSIISSRVSQLEGALLVRNRPDLLMALDRFGLSRLSASLHSALSVLSIESPHREMVKDAISRVETQQSFNSGN